MFCLRSLVLRSVSLYALPLAVHVCCRFLLTHKHSLKHARTHARTRKTHTRSHAHNPTYMHTHTHTHANRNIRAERQKLVREQQAIESKVCECVCVCAYMCVYVSECWCGCLCLSLFVLVFACSFLSSSHVRISFILTSPFRHFRQFFLFFLFFWVFDSIAGQRRVQQDQQTREGRQQGFVFCVCVCVRFALSCGTLSAGSVCLLLVNSISSNLLHLRLADHSKLNTTQRSRCLWRSVARPTRTNSN